MPSTRSRARNHGLFIACILTSVFTGAACNDDDAADNGHEAGDHDEHGEHDHDENEIVGKLTGTVCPDDSTLTYDNFGQTFMETYCLRCHSETVTGAARMDAPADHNFDTQGEIQLLRGHMDQKAGSGPDATNTSMPIGGPTLSVEDRQKLSEWLACGAN